MHSTGSPLGAFHENMGNSLNRAVGLPEISSNPRDFGLSFITVSNFSPLGDEYNNPQHSVTNVFQLMDTVTYSRGKHLVRFGVDFRALQQNAFRDVQSRGLMAFSDFGQVTGNGLADLLLGFITYSGGARLDNPQYLRTRSLNLFVQDSYRIRPNVTLQLGLRHEYNAPPVDRYDRANTYDPRTQSLVAVGAGDVPRSAFEPDRNNWAPRVGIAWSPGDGDRTVVRAGYGIYYDQASLAPGEGLYFNKPYYDFKLYFPLQGLPLTLNDPFPANYPFAIPGSALGFDRHLRTPYFQHWNLAFGRQVGANGMAEVVYAGSAGRRILAARDINQAAAEPGPAQPAARPAVRRHRFPGVPRQLLVQQPSVSLPAAAGQQPCLPDLLYLRKVPRRRFDLFLELGRRKLPAGQRQPRRRARAVEFRRAAPPVAELLV